jgi:hypothetical protein
MSDEWIEWIAAPCPLNQDVEVTVHLNSGARVTGIANEFNWLHLRRKGKGNGSFVVAYLAPDPRDATIAEPREDNAAMASDLLKLGKLLWPLLAERKNL